MNNQERQALIALAENIISYSHAQPGLQELARIAMEQLNPKSAPETGWTGNSAADAALIMLDRINTTDYGDDDRIEGVKRVIRRMAVSPAPVVPDEPTGGDAPSHLDEYEATCWVAGACWMRGKILGHPEAIENTAQQYEALAKGDKC